MKNRILSLDLARGFTVLFIAPIHAMLLFSEPSVRETFIGNIFRFIAEGPGAQLLMTLMGISFYFNRKITFEKVISKVFSLLMIGYFLNVWKFVLPAAIGILPKALLNELTTTSSNTILLQLFLIGDILQFVALAFFILYVLSCIFKKTVFYFAFALLICFASSLFYDSTGSNPFSNYLLHLISGQPPQVFFPLLPWFIYPLIGIIIGYCINDDKSILPCLPLGVALVVIGHMISELLLPCTDASFYRTCPGHTIFHVGIVLAWLGAWELISVRIKYNRFFRFLQYLSKHITLIYFIQWILISWLLCIVGYQTLGFALSMVAIVLVEVNVAGFAFIINELRKKSS